jgi:hypothetical protein
VVAECNSSPATPFTLVIILWKPRGAKDTMARYVNEVLTFSKYTKLTYISGNSH